MSKKLLQTTSNLAMASLAVYKDIFDVYKDMSDEDLPMRLSDLKPRPILKPQPKQEHCFIIKGRQIMATSRKDAIKMYNHKYK